MDNLNGFILIAVTEIIKCAIQLTSLDVAFVIVSQAVCGCVNPPWRAKDVIFSVMHIPALPIGKRWACKELGWLRAQGTEARCARLRLPVNTKDASLTRDSFVSINSLWEESWIAQSVWDLFYIPPISSTFPILDFFFYSSADPKSSYFP